MDPSDAISSRPSTTITSASCVSARRARSGPKSRDTKAAARAAMPAAASSVAPRARRGDGVCERPLALDGLREQQLVPFEAGEAPPDCDEPVPAPCRPAQRAAPCGEPARAGASCGPLGPRQRGVLLQHAGLELLQRRRGLEAEGLDQGGASRPERLERLGLPAGAVERDHQLAAQPLVEWMLGHELLELGDELRAAAELELGFEALLRDRQANLAQPLDDRPRERLEHEIGERLAAPHGERFPVEPDGRLGVPGASAEPAASARRSKKPRSSSSGATRMR